MFQYFQGQVFHLKCHVLILLDKLQPNTNKYEKEFEVMLWINYSSKKKSMRSIFGLKFQSTYGPIFVFLLKHQKRQAEIILNATE